MFERFNSLTICTQWGSSVLTSEHLLIAVLWPHSYTFRLGSQIL